MSVKHIKQNVVKKKNAPITIITQVNVSIINARNGSTVKKKNANVQKFANNNYLNNSL